MKALRTAYSTETFGKIDAFSLCTSSVWSIKVGVKIAGIKKKKKSQTRIPATITNLEV